jgi:peptidoglycan-N-acetylglucosamine deacetylase
MRRIATAGHEIASHGWDHKRVFTLGPEEFRADLRRAGEAIEKSCGIVVRGYRAPSFSIDARTPWAHRILAEEDYAYSSSVAPLAHDHYGWPEASRFAFRPLAGSDLIELPVTTVELGGRRLAAGGGGFFRLLPYRFSDWAIRRVNREGRPAIFYFHPWEVDPGQPRVKGAPLKSRLRHYSRLSSMRRRLLKLFKSHRWGTTGEVAGLEQARLA